jgi:hypothetical protein
LQTPFAARGRVREQPFNAVDMLPFFFGPAIKAQNSIVHRQGKRCVPLGSVANRKTFQLYEQTVTFFT